MVRDLTSRIWTLRILSNVAILLSALIWYINIPENYLLAIHITVTLAFVSLILVCLFFARKDRGEMRVALAMATEELAQVSQTLATVTRLAATKLDEEKRSVLIQPVFDSAIKNAESFRFVLINIGPEANTLFNELNCTFAATACNEGAKSIQSGRPGNFVSAQQRLDTCLERSAALAGHLTQPVKVNS